MPRHGLKSEVVSAPPPMILAAAKNYSIGKSRRIAATGSQLQGEQWQDGCWVFYDIVGEFRYAVDWVGNLLSKAKLYVSRDGEPVEDTDIAAMALDALFGGEEGQSEMLRMLGINFTVAGEAYIIGYEGDTDDDWMVIASTEVRRDGNNNFRIGDETIEGSRALVIRLWRPHPRRPKKSNSPARAVIPILAELDKLTQHVAAQIDSRLAGAGLLILPSETTFPAVPVTTLDEDGNEVTTLTSGDATSFVNKMIEVMETAIQDRADSSALVPIILQVAGEYIEGVKHMMFWSGLDAEAVNLRTEAIRRLALGMDMPPEVLTGVADVNHWGAWQIDEAAIKAHAEPLIAVITSSLTNGYLRPVLEADMSPEEAARYDIHADTSQLRMRPNRSKEALELWDRGVLSSEALLRENGFDPLNDEMDRSELVNWLLRKVAGGSTTPELVADALEKLGVILAGAPSPAIESTEAPQPRSLRDHPVRDVPEEDDGVPEELVAVSEVIVFRALERAGNRLKTKMAGKVPTGVPAAELYLALPALSPSEVDEALTDVWSCTDRFAITATRPGLAATLDQYARTLMIFRRPHTYEQLRSHLSGMPMKMLEAV